MQIIKASYRKYGDIRKKSSKDELSKRSNIPPIVQELYFLIWLAYFFVVWKLDMQNNLISIYYLAESSLWVLYYTIFRRFFEEAYSIYHPLEHLVIILVIIPTQAIAIAQLYQITTKQSFIALIGNGTIDLPIYVYLLGILYLAIALSLIMTSFPTEKRKSDNSLKVAIIGSGDVVLNKILPAIKSTTNVNWIRVFTKDIPRSYEKDSDFFQIKYIDDSIKDISKAQMVWIATPSNTHIHYLEKLISINRFLVLEKPITVIRNELIIAKNIIHSKNRDKIFFLSYYLLEKALPLVYLMRPSSYYEKYLDISSDKSDLFYTFGLLGKLKKIDVFIIEGKDDRLWPHYEGNGGHLLETFIHNVIIASQFAGVPESWSEVHLSKGLSNNPDGTQSYNVISMDAKAEDKSINLLMAKNILDESKLKKGVKLIFENGVIDADFVEQKVFINCFTSEKKVAIAVNKQYMGKYDIQVDLANNCFYNHVDPALVDGLSNQIEIIEWLLSLEDTKYDILDSASINNKIDSMIQIIK